MSYIDLVFEPAVEEALGCLRFVPSVGERRRGKQRGTGEKWRWISLPSVGSPWLATSF
jgi:hypothetical protein